MANYHNTGKEDLLHYMKRKIKALAEENIKLRKVVDIAKELYEIEEEFNITRRRLI